MEPARLLLVRHTETDWNRENRWQGESDLPLNARGVAQLAEVHAGLGAEPVAAIYTSDLLRAQQMATWLGVKLGLTPRVTDRVRERSMGAWEGKTPAEAAAEWPELYPRVEADPLRTPPPGGESFATLLARVVPVLARVAARHPGETALVVTHGGVLKAVACTLLDLPLGARETLGFVNGASLLLEAAGTRWTILKPEPLAERQTAYALDAGRSWEP